MCPKPCRKIERHVPGRHFPEAQDAFLRRRPIEHEAFALNPLARGLIDGKRKPGVPGLVDAENFLPQHRTRHPAAILGPIRVNDAQHLEFASQHENIVENGQAFIFAFGRVILHALIHPFVDTIAISRQNGSVL